MAPLRVWVLEVDADASGVRVVAGDYEDATLGMVMGSQLFLDAALRLRYAPANRNTRALVTCRSRAQAHQLARFFERHQPAGAPRVGLILGDTKTDQRRQLLADFEAGVVDTLVQVGVLIEGWDSAVCKVTLQFMGHTPPGRCCSELQLEAMAIGWSPASPLRGPLAVARALAHVCEEAQNASDARPR